MTLAIGGKEVAVRVAGVIRDYARTWGAVMMPLEDYRRLTGETRAHDLAVRLAPGVDSRAAESAIRRALPQAQGLVFEDARELRKRSLEIFDHSFAVTYALEAAAIAIGLAGVTSSFAALAWSRRREFGVLRFLGLRRGEVLRLLVIEGLATGALGALIGLVSGIAISVVPLDARDALAGRNTRGPPRLDRRPLRRRRPRERGAGRPRRSHRRRQGRRVKKSLNHRDHRGK